MSHRAVINEGSSHLLTTVHRQEMISARNGTYAPAQDGKSATDCLTYDKAFNYTGSALAMWNCGPYINHLTPNDHLVAVPHC